MRALLESPPAPDARSGQSGGTADPEREPRGWRALAVALAGLLAQSDGALVSDAQRHKSELASQRAAHDRDLLHDREAFLGLVAHELKTPAAVIKAYAELLDAQLADASTPASTLREVVGHIRDQAAPGGGAR